MKWRALGGNRCRVAQAERPERQIHVVACHVGNVTATKVPPLAPVLRQVSGVIRSFGRRSKPKIPMDVRRYRRRLGRSITATPASPRPGVYLMHFTDRARLNDLNDTPIIILRVNLR